MAKSEEACTASAEALADGWRAAIHVDIPVSFALEQWRTKDENLIRAASEASAETVRAMNAVGQERPSERRTVLMDWAATQAGFCQSAVEPSGHSLLSLEAAIRNERASAAGFVTRLAALPERVGGELPAVPRERWAPSAEEYERKKRAWARSQEVDIQAPMAPAEKHPPAMKVRQVVEITPAPPTRVISVEERARWKEWVPLYGSEVAKLKRAAALVQARGAYEPEICGELKQAVASLRIPSSPDPVIDAKVGGAMREFLLGERACEQRSALPLQVSIQKANVQLQDVEAFLDRLR